jgi:carboxyl-terminal processing protease
VLAGAAGGDALEGLQQPGDLVVGHDWPGVGHGEPAAVGVVAGGDAYGKLSARSREQAAMATMYAMIAALNNNHSYWQYPHFFPGCHHGLCPPYGLGIYTTPDSTDAQTDPGVMLPPLYVSQVYPLSPAGRAGVRPGDVITKINGSAPFTGGTPSPGVMNLLNPRYPQRQPVQLTLRWPVTGATRTITLTPARFSTGPLPRG